MLRILPTRGPKAYESFLSALSKTSHQDCTELLREKEDLTSSQNSVQPKPKDVSGDDPLDHCRQRAPVGIDLSFSGRSQLGMFDIQATTKSKYYDHIVLLYLESRRCHYRSIIFACFYLYITVVIDYSDIDKMMNINNEKC